MAEKARPKPSQTGSNDFNPGEFLPPGAASCSQEGLWGPPNPAATSPGQGWMRPRGLHLPSPPSPTGDLGKGNPTAPLIPHRDRSRGAPTAVSTAPGPPQTPRTPVSWLVTCAAGTGAQQGRRQSPARPAVPRAGRTQRAQTWLSVLPKVWGVLGARGLAFSRQGAEPKNAEPVCQARGRFGSRLAAGSISSCSVAAVPRSGATRFSVPGLGR